MKKEKCFVGYLKEKNNNKNVIDYFLIKEVILENFREKISRVYDYEYIEDMKLLQTSSENITNDIYFYELKKEQVNIQRTFFNLINSYSLSIDHIKKILSSSIGKENNHYKFISARTSFYYDNFAGYKIIERLRNYCQHKYLVPIEIHKSSKDNTKIFINKEMLEKDKIKNKIRLELDNQIPFDFLFLVAEWFKKVIDLYDDLFYLFAKYAEEQSKYLISLMSSIKEKLDRTKHPQLYIIYIDDRDNPYKSFVLPVKSALNAINITNNADFKDKIEFISNYVDELEKSKQI